MINKNGEYMEKIKVGLVGYGTVGKRVVDAVLLQPDMEITGITAVSHNYRINMARDLGIPIYAYNEKQHLEDEGIKIAGDIKDLVKKSDIIVDCAPKPWGMKNKEIYMKEGVKAIFQGGEKPEVAEVSFVAQCNYHDGLNKDFIRVVSCNTTGMCRTLKLLDNMYGVQDVKATLIRRASDPGQVKKGPINSIIPTMNLPSHHGPDVLTVMPNMKVFTSAVVVSTTLMHMHSLNIRLNKNPNCRDIKEAIAKTSRLRLVRAKEHLGSTAQLAELGKDLGFKRGDLMEICIWDESISVKNDEVFFFQAVHQESDIIPENIDAIRAAMGFKDAEKSISITDKTLKLDKD